MTCPQRHSQRFNPVYTLQHNLRTPALHTTNQYGVAHHASVPLYRTNDACLSSKVKCATAAGRLHSWHGVVGAAASLVFFRSNSLYHLYSNTRRFRYSKAWLCAAFSSKGDAHKATVAASSIRKAYYLQALLLLRAELVAAIHPSIP
jgi:hypothetical protein